MDENELICLAQNGNKEAFQDLIRFYYPYVSKFIHTIVKNDEATCEDLTQETFLKLIRSIERFDRYGKAQFSTYVITIAKRTCFDYFRKNRHIEVDIEEQWELADPQDIQHQIEKMSDVQKAMELLDTLPDEQAIAIRMKYIESKTLDEIAQELSSQPKTIKSRIHNGMVKLRREMKKGGPPDG